MYFLYLDESGNESDPTDRFFVLGGLAVCERFTFFLSRELAVLRTKKLVYSPLSGDVSFQLQVVNFEHHAMASESVRVLAPLPNWLPVPAQEHPQSPAGSVLP